MKRACSLLLEELLAAEGVSYADSRRYQLVCASCYEPVFKVSRRSSQGNEQLNYFSHYRADKSYDDACELRVEAITDAQAEAANIIARGQKLRYFLSVLQRAVAIYYHEAPEVGPEAAYARGKEMVALMSRSKPLTDFLNQFYRAAREKRLWLHPDNIEQLFNTALPDMQVGRNQFPTTFSLSLQKRIATDVLRHVMSQKARPSFDFLFYHGYQLLMGRLTNVQRGRETAREIIFSEYKPARLKEEAEQNTRTIQETLVQLPNTSRKTAQRLLQICHETRISWPPAARLMQPMLAATTTLLEQLHVRIWMEMAGIILFLPYYELLQEARRTQSSVA